VQCTYLNNRKHIYFIDANKIINAGIKDLFLNHYQNRKIQYREIKVNKNIIESNIRNLSQVIFEVSQKCSLYCTYCSYSGAYFYNRKASSKLMTFETAKKAIDYVFDFIKMRYKKDFTLGFYGGEPTYNFNTIQKIVAYSKRVFKGWKINYTITTNGTLLNENIIHFLIENNFNTLISIDGPAENHDSKRVYPDGSGSFNVVIENLKRIKDIHRDYYYNNVTFSAVHSRDLSLKKLYRFFIRSELVNKNKVNFSSVNPFDTDYYEKNPYSEPKYRKELDDILDRVIDKKLKGKNLYPIEDDFFVKINDLAKQLKRDQLSLLANTCMFNNRLYINAYGAFHICEKMNDKFPIGDIHNGFNYSRMQEIICEFTELIRRNCLDCEARFLCTRCYIHFARNGKFEMNAGFCRKKKQYINKLEKIIQLYEKGVLK
jgi:uncharacterized protein